MKRDPIVGKNVSFPFQVSVACWIDLLGYGAMIAKANFNPLHPDATAASERLRHFHAIVAQHSARNFPTLVLNDGAVAYRDLSLRTAAVTRDFVKRAWALYSDLKNSEKQHGYPGPRVVLAAGFRMKGRRAGIDARTGHFRSILERFQAGKIDAGQAIREAAHIRAEFDIIPQLQANYAFTKAYVAETSGKSGGLSGPNFFVDMWLFDDPPPDWLTPVQTVNWKDDRLKLEAKFGMIDQFEPPGLPLGIADGIAVAQKLAGDQDVLLSLRDAARSSAKS